MTKSFAPFIVACCSPNDITDTDRWENYQAERQLYAALAKQAEAAQAEVITEADDFVALFDQMLAEVSR